MAPGIAAMQGGAALSKAISKGGIEPGAEVGATGEMLRGGSRALLVQCRPG